MKEINNKEKSATEPMQFNQGASHKMSGMDIGMKSVEEIMKDKKEELDKLEVPYDLEERLKGALENKQKPKRKNHWKLRIAAVIIAVILIIYNIDTLAFYGKKLIGYEEVMNSTLRQLNELDKGQVIDKTYTFKNGVSVTLDGVMYDDNQLLAFYTIKDPSGHADNLASLNLMSMKGSFSDLMMHSGQGIISDDKTEVKWMESYDPPLFFEKTLRFRFALNDKNSHEEGEIVFKLDRSKAMGSTLKQNINKSVKVDETNVHFNTILASPTSTVIKGKLQSTFALALDSISGERFFPKELKVQLIANGNEINHQGGGMSTDSRGITFEKKFDTLPKDLQSLQLKLVSFAAEHEVEKEVSIREGMGKETIDILEHDIDIDNVYKKDGNTYITITTEDSVVLTRIHLIADGKVIDLKNTTTENNEKLLDGTILHTRTLCFPGTGNDYKLDIARMTYTKVYNETIDIPID